jgi:hypothetical protein
MNTPLTFTPAQVAMQDAYRAAVLSNEAGAVFAPMLPYYAAIQQGNTRAAADFVDHFRSVVMGYPQYADTHAGEVHLVRVRRQIRTKGGIRFTKGETAIAIMVPADKYMEEHMLAYSVRGDIGTALPDGSYTVIETVPAR